MEYFLVACLTTWILTYKVDFVISEGAVIFGQSRMHPPLITVQPQQEVVFKSGEQIELPCIASGSPQPRYKWLKNGEELDINGAGMTQKTDIGTLVIQEPSTVHEGVYQCLATNQLGTAVSIKTDLRGAKLELFEDTPHKEHQVPLHTPVSLRCTPPSGHPRSVVYWGEYTGLGKLIPIKMSRRVLQDYEGNLYIANVIDGDSLQGANYTCIVKNKVLNSMVLGYEQKIVPVISAASPSYLEPQLQWSSESPTTALEGTTTKLKCIFSGYPTPNVSWTRSDGKMAEKNYETVFGTELTIPSVVEGDTGTYCCGAVNQAGRPATQTCIDLAVEAMPKWKKRPENVETEEGEAINFLCEATGNPSPKIEWSVNGAPIDKLPSNERRVVTEKTVSYANLTKADTQVLQCNASNKHGYIFANAYLNVAEGPVAEAVMSQSTGPWLVVILCATAAVLLAMVILSVLWAVKRRRSNKHQVLEYEPHIEASKGEDQERGAKENM